ncbi:ABC transporter substrate-binding protein [Xylanimonas oleitrophica]|uniref:ABC transporter substrate-binding protein n=1 Tax=Xylanimonas oleitrophica TaxID=2607479 RepID=A0A2W5WPI9_9MICO|nr:ABC transporter substrate-binding protein [Xylanimonas oleitrophica]PZR53479.1 ABC transporter substrate-binding protein [Xylanimonas oleitrophica]
MARPHTRGSAAARLTPRAALVAAATALTLAACTAGSTSPDPSAGPGEARTDATVVVGAEPVNLDFTTTAGAAIPQLLLNNVYETLVKVDQDGEIVPLLAESWTVSDDRTVYDFTLRQGVTFSDGSDLTAEDVAASFDRVKTDWLHATKAKMDVVASTEALAPDHVRVTLSRPSNAWLFDIATAVGAVFPEELGFDLRTTAVGSGPYEVTDVVQGDHITLTGRDDYWGGAPELDTVTVRYMTDTTAATNALRAGDVDMLYGSASADQVVQLEAGGQFQVLEGTSTGDVLLSLNNRAAPFDDVRVRQAISYAIDRQAVMDTASAGYGTLVGAMVTPQDPYYEDLTDVYPYDPDRARELLAEAGATDLHVTFDVPNLGYATTAAEVIVSQLADVGVTATIVTDEFPAVWLDKVYTRHDYQMSVIQHSEARDLLTVFSPDYYLGYDDAEVRALAEQADAGTPEEYVAGMRQVVRRIVDDAAGVVLYLAPTLVVADQGLAGIKANAVTESMDLTDLHWQ